MFAILEHELRTAGRVSFPTCEALRRDPCRAGFEACLAYLGSVVFAPDPDQPPLERRDRVRMCRMLLLSLGAHTPSPCETSFMIERAVEAAQQMPGAELSDLVHAMFALLAETPGPTTEPQARFIRELAGHLEAKRRAGHTVEDFVWLAVRIADPVVPITTAQAFLASHTLPRRLRRATAEAILAAVRASPLADEVAETLAD